MSESHLGQATPGPGGHDLRAILEQRCLVGFLACADALVGGDPENVCAAFRSWRDEAWRGWPWLPGLAWTALEPLGVRFATDDPVMVTVGRMLVGAETDAERYRDASGALHDRADEVAAWEPLPAAGADLAGELRRRSLVSAVDQFWADLAAGMRGLHEPVVARDRHQADTRIMSLRRQLEEGAERLQLLVERVSAAPPATAPLAPAPAATPAPEPAQGPEAEPTPDPGPAAPPEPEPTPTPAPTERLDLDGGPPTEPFPVIEAPSAAAEPEVVRSTRPHPSTAPPRAEPRRAATEESEVEEAEEDEVEVDLDDEDVEYRTVREHRLAPVIFLLGVTVGALYWIFHVLSGAF